MKSGKHIKRILWPIRRLLYFLLFLVLLRGSPIYADGSIYYFPLLTSQRPPTTLPVSPELVPYTVQPNDTLFDIARRFHRPLHQVTCALPRSRNAAVPLTPGETLLIPPERSVCHVVGQGQTLAAIARAYGVSPGDIIALPQNELRVPPYWVPPGQRVLVPLPPDVDISPWTFGDGQFIWPVQGTISQPWSSKHPALDIVAPEETPIAAADTGVVTWAGWDTTGYGWLVIVDHGNGYHTLYAHLHSIWVGRGERVVKGQPIGTVGTTGRSTGPHLHFEVRDYGVKVNPLTLLPAPAASPSNDGARAGQ